MELPWLVVLALAVAVVPVARAQTGPPVITSQPQPQATVPGGRAIFTVMASGTAPLAFQWLKNGAPLAGATGDVLILTNAQSSDAGMYSVTVSNALGSVTSANVGLSVNARRGGDVDSSFCPSASLNRSVYSTVVQPNGKVLIAGDFTAVQGAARGRVARLNSDGSTDHTFMNALAGANNDVKSVAMQADGKVLIGGWFNTVNGAPRSGLARLQADGSLDTGFRDSLAEAYADVNCLTVQADGKVVIGGFFFMVDGAVRNNIARLNADGSLDTGFLNGLAGADSTVLSVTVQADGKVLIGGWFTAVDGVARNHIARLNADGSLDTGFLNALAGTDSTVSSVAVQADGKVLIGGSFTTVNGVARPYLARLLPDGSLDTGFLNGLAGPGSEVLSVTLQAGGQVLIGGWFATVNGEYRPYLARLQPDGSLDTGFLNGLYGVEGIPYSVAAQADGKILVGGGFSMVNGVARGSIARLNADGSLDAGFLNGSDGANSWVNSVAAQADGKVLIGGAFTTVNGVARPQIARLQADGSLDTEFLKGLAGLDNQVQSVVVQDDAKVLIGGWFNTVNGVARNRIARLQADGSLDTGFLSGLAGANHAVSSVAVQTDGKVLIGGEFTTVNGVARNRIARLQTDGSLDSGFLNGLTGGSSWVESVAVQADGKVLIGGGFTTVNGVVRNRIARLHADGSLDAGFLSGLSGANDYVVSVAVQPDGKVLMGGGFTTVNGVARSGIARLHADGSLDTGFLNALSGVSGEVKSVAVQPDGKVLVGGWFITVNGVARNNIARLNADGSLDTSFMDGLTGPNGHVYSVVVQRDGRILVCGQFGGFNDVPASGVARLWGSKIPVILRQPRDQAVPAGSEATFSVSVSGPPPLNCQWWFNGSTPLAGATNAILVLSNVQPAHAGNYSVVVSNPSGAATSAVAVLTVFGPPVVLVDGVTYPGNAVTVSAPVQVQAESDLADGVIFYTLDGSDPFFGLLYLGTFTVSQSATVRAVVFTSDFSQWAEAAPFAITVLAPPVIVMQPQSQVAAAGSTVVFEVTVTGSAPLAYQWYFNAVPLLGAANAVLVRSNVSSADTGAYTVRVNNSVGTMTSAAATLTVAQPPAFSEQPAGTNVIIGDSVTFRVTATGTPPLRYQWRKNGANIPGATSASYTIPSVQASDGGIYTVVVANDAGTVVSQPVQLGIVAPVVPPGDNFADRVALVGTDGYVSGTNLFATREPGEPQHARRPGSNSVWYSWTAPANGIATFQTVGSTFDTLLAVYTGRSVSNLTEVASDEDRGGFFTSEVQCNVEGGTEYQIAIDGFVGAQGTFLLHWSFEATSAELPVITSQPTSGTVRQGDSFTCNVTATGSNLTYQWLFFDEPIPGAVSSSYAISSVQPQHVGTYSVQVSSGTNAVTSQPAVLEIGPVAGVQSQDKPENLLQSTGGGGNLMTGPSKVAAAPASTVPATIPVAAGTTDSQIMNTTNSSLQPLETNACGVIGGASRWLGLRPEIDGTMIVDTLGSSFPTVLTVYRAPAVYADAFEFWASLVFRTCTNRTPDCGCSRLRFNVRAGTNYLVSVDGVEAATGIAQLNWALGRAPEVLINGLGNATVHLGGSVTWAVAVANAMPAPTFQWQRDGVDLPGGTSAVLTLDHVQLTDAGEYSAVVSNALGSVRQFVGRLTVDPASSVQRDSRFDSGQEGWGISGAAATVSHDQTGGHPGGCVTALGAAGQWWYWQAPASFLGDQSAAYNGWLEFDLRQASANVQDSSQPDVVLLGGGLRLVCRTRHVPTTDWVRYRVPLHERSWQTGDVNGPAPSWEEIRRVLGSLTGLQIRANLSADQTTSSLDNVAWVGPTPVQLTVRRVQAEGLVLAWPSWAATYILEGSAALTTDWTPLDATRTTEGDILSVTIPTTNGHSFFRLRRPGSTGP